MIKVGPSKIKFVQRTNLRIPTHTKHHHMHTSLPRPQNPLSNVRNDKHQPPMPALTSRHQTHHDSRDSLLTALNFPHGPHPPPDPDLHKQTPSMTPPPRTHTYQTPHPQNRHNPQKPTPSTTSVHSNS
jgi:hypothetical protein